MAVMKRSKGQRLGGEEGNNPIFVLTCGDVDRDGEVVSPTGGDFHDFQKNPIVIDNHSTDGSSLSVALGRVNRIWNEEIGEGTRWESSSNGVALGPRRMALLGEIEWSQEEEGQKARRLSDAGVLNTVSISFAPIGTPRKNEHGRAIYDKWKLLEVTICPVPSQASAVRLKSLSADKASSTNPFKGSTVKTVEGYADEVAAKMLSKTVSERDGQFYVQFGDGTERGPFPSEDAAMEVHRQPDVSAKGAYGKAAFNMGSNPLDQLLLESPEAVEQALDEAEVPKAMRAAVKGVVRRRLAVSKSSQEIDSATAYINGDESQLPKLISTAERIGRSDLASAIRNTSRRGTGGAWEAATELRTELRYRQAQGAKTMNRKCWIRKNVAWLLKSDGEMTEEVVRRLKDMGIDEVRIEDAPPQKSIKKSDPSLTEWVEQELAEPEHMDKRINPFQPIQDRGQWKIINLDTRETFGPYTSQSEAAAKASEWNANQTARGADKSKADEVADRAEEIVAQGALPEDAIEAAMAEEGVPEEQQASIKQLALKRIRKAYQEKFTGGYEILVSGNNGKVTDRSGNVVYEGTYNGAVKWLKDRGERSLTFGGKSLVSVKASRAGKSLGFVTKAGDIVEEEEVMTKGEAGDVIAAGKISDPDVKMELHPTEAKAIPEGDEMQTQLKDLTDPMGDAEDLDTGEVLLASLEKAADKDSIAYQSGWEDGNKGRSRSGMYPDRGGRGDDKTKQDYESYEQGYKDGASRRDLDGYSTKFPRRSLSKADYQETQVADLDKLTEGEEDTTLTEGEQVSKSDGPYRVVKYKEGIWLVQDRYGATVSRHSSQQEADAAAASLGKDLTPGEKATKSALTACVRSKVAKGMDLDDACASCGKAALAKGVTRKTLRKVAPLVVRAVRKAETFNFKVGDKVAVGGMGGKTGVVIEEITQQGHQMFRVKMDEDGRIVREYGKYMTKKSVTKSLDSSDGLPMGYRKLKECMDALIRAKGGMHKAEQGGAMDAIDAALKCLARGLKQYKGIEDEDKADQVLDVAGEEVEVDTGVTPDELKSKALRPLQNGPGGRWIIFDDETGEVHGNQTFASRAEAEQAIQKIGKSVKLKRLSKAQADALEEDIATLDSMIQSGDTPKHLKAALRNVAANLCALKSKPALEEVEASVSKDCGEDEMIDLATSKRLEKALDSLRADVGGLSRSNGLWPTRN